MKTSSKLIAILSLTALTSIAAWAQPKGDIPGECWRIVNGPGRGALLHDAGGDGIIVDLYHGAVGHVASPDRCKCIHYHGILFGIDDPNPPACGWGCIVPVNCGAHTASEAAAGLWDAIEFIGNNVNGDLADKLADLYDEMEYYSYVGCYGVVDALADAFADELYGYFLQSGYQSLFNPYVQMFTAFVNLRLAELSPAPFFPAVGRNSVQILRQIGSGPRGRLLDAGPRITLAVGQMLTLQMLAEAGLQTPYHYLWQYKFKGMQEGEIPSAAAVAIAANYISLISFNSTVLRLTGLVRHANGNFYRDTISVNWVGQNVE